MDLAAIERVLREHVCAPKLLRALPRMQRWHAQLPAGSVVVHGDPHFFNRFAGTGGEITGLIDLDMIATGDRTSSTCSRGQVVRSPGSSTST